jgi:signal transduction histidine kinase/CheY-like chemotaxis protein/HPt (histidine-containing phosphotransfer) domain-containing protein
VTSPILLNDEKIGSVLLVSTLEKMQQVLIWNVVHGSLVLISAFFCTYFLATRFQKMFTVPIERLIAAMEIISEYEDFSRRVDKWSDDELGVLTDGFNAMLEQIQQRDDKIKATVEELNRARAIAEDANRAKSRFLAVMSHEIRTPMNGVLGMAELLAESELSSRQRDFLETLRQSGNRLLEIINDILDLSKAEAGRMELAKIDFDLRLTIEDVAHLLANQAHRKGVELVCDIPVDLPTALQGDPGRLRQVLLNLVSNAVKFTEKGEIVIRLRKVEEREREVLMRLEVEDTGIGIAQDLQKLVFAPFSQVDDSTTRRYQGTGLGLAIARQFSELMGGEIGVESEPGCGSTFWFTVPFEIQTAKPELEKGDELQGLHVLFVENNPTGFVSLLQQLKAWGTSAVGVHDGAEALRRLREANSSHPFDLILIDLSLPDFNGFDLVRVIREDSRFAAVRLVVLGTMGHFDGLEKARQLDIQALLDKPLRQSQLYNCLLQVFAETRGTATSLDQGGQLSSHESRKIYPCHILLAEDNPVNQKVAVARLEGMGCRIDTAPNGLAAVDAISRNTYDLVFMDCQMPEMDGFEATRMIRESERLSEPQTRLPIVALTAHALEGDRERCLAAGMDDYLGKPFTGEQLREILERWIPEKGRRQETSEPKNILPSASGEVQPPAEQQNSLLDPEALGRIRACQQDGAEDLVGQVIALFQQETPRLLRDLQYASSKDDVEALKFAAHSMKSCSFHVGAVQLAGLSRELEMTARTQDLKKAKELLKKIEESVAQTLPALEEQMRSYGQ